MKKVLVFLLVARCVPNAIGQGEINPKAQLYGASCWAAVLEMAATKLKPNNPELDQCFFIKKTLGNGYSTMDCQKCTTSLPGTIPNYAVRTALGWEIKYLADSFLSKKTSVRNKPIPIGSIRSSLLFNKKPILYSFVYSDLNQSHIVVMENILSLTSQGNKINLLEIVDPWPVCKGTRYFLPYERYAASAPIVSLDTASSLTITFTDSTSGFSDNSNETLHYMESERMISRNMKITAERFLDFISDTLFLPFSFCQLTNIPTSLYHRKKMKVGKPIRIRMSGGVLNTSTETLDIPDLTYINDEEYLVPLMIGNRIQTVLHISYDSTNNPTDYKKWYVRKIQDGKDYNGKLNRAGMNGNKYILYEGYNLPNRYLIKRTSQISGSIRKFKIKEVF